MVDFTRTKRALGDYDKHAGSRLQLRRLRWIAPAFYVYVEHIAADFVRQAYMIDAGDQAEWSEVSIASVDDIREVIERHEGGNA